MLALTTTCGSNIELSIVTKLRRMGLPVDVCLILTGLELAKMSSMPVDVLEEASAIASNLTTAKSLLSEEFPDATKKTHELGRQLVQVARNSLLDQESLR